MIEETRFNIPRVKMVLGETLVLSIKETWHILRLGGAEGST